MKFYIQCHSTPQYQCLLSFDYYRTILTIE